jgi:pilus assembly protein FimV
VELRSKFFGLILMGLALDGSGLTLGRVRGAAVVGQPLDVSIQLQLAPDESAASLCMEADVFHADTRQEPTRVRVSVEPGQQAQTANVRVLSTSYVDEPVVTVYLKAGCGQKVSRRYVLLADFPSEPASPVPAIALPAVTPTAAEPIAATDAAANAPATPAPLASERIASTTKPARVVAAPRLKAPAAPKPAAPLARVPAPRKIAPMAAVKPVVPKALVPPPDAKSPAPASPAQVEDKLAAGRNAGQSRLKLDPLVLLAERVATLESSSSVPAAEVMRETQRLQSLEDSVKALVSLAAKNEANLQDLRTKLLRAESDRVPMGWIYGLVGLLLACLAAIAYLWSRTRGGSAVHAKGNWWSGSRTEPAAGAPVPEATLAPLAPASSQPGSLSGPTPLTAAGNQSRFISAPAPITHDDSATDMDVSLVEMSESNFDNLMQSDKAHSALRRGPLPAAPMAPSTRALPLGPARVINSDELFDIRQQAEFFVSLGQTDQALRILENQINDSGETSPLIYLDLLKIFHSLNLKTDFRQFREDFNLLFNCKVPEFAAFKDEGKSLEEYPHVLAHITALWNTPKVQMVIEGSIFRDPLDERSTPFDLAAFRDLLLLHAVAQSTANADAPVSDLAPLHAGVTASYQPMGGAATAQPGAISPIAMPTWPPKGGPAKSGKVSSVDIALNTEPGFLQVTSDSSLRHSELDIDLSDLVAPAELSEETGAGLADFPKLSNGNEPASSLTSKAKASTTPVDVDVDLISFDLPEASAAGVSPKPKPKR